MKNAAYVDLDFIELIEALHKFELQQLPVKPPKEYEVPEQADAGVHPFTVELAPLTLPEYF